jgi:predicted MFS family arabinose efflux permease
LVLTSGIATVGFLILAQLPATGGYSPVLAAVTLVGFGSAGTAFGSMVTAAATVAGDEQGVVGGMINTSRQVGAALGASLLPAVTQWVDGSAGETGASGARAAMFVAAAVAATATVVAYRDAALRVRRAVAV